MGMPNQKFEELDRDTIRALAKRQGYAHVESFSGPGGMSLGLEWAGFELALAFDYNEKAVETHNYNLGNKCIVADAAELSGKEILKRIGMKRGELALFAGGPPCQGFSKQKRGAHLGDQRNELVSHYIRLVDELHPKFFLFENVAIFGQKRGRQYLQEMFDTLADYVIYPHFYNSSDYGLAQTRERFIAVGRRKDQQAGFQIPKPTVTKKVTVGDILKGLPEPPADYTDHPDYPNHQNARVTEINIKRFSYVPQGGGWQDIPHELRLKCHQETDTKSGGWPDVYGRLEWDGQCPTITGGFDSFTRGRYGHPLYNRPLTPREAARLQGFPDTHVFKGNRGDVRSQIGNAVPPPLAEAVGIEILRSLLAADGIIEDTVHDTKLNTQLVLSLV
jgi:DNA (cytosine-5)-methyltransferase 1